MIGSVFNFIIQVPKFGPPHTKNMGSKTCKNRGDFGQLQTSIANVSGTDRNIQNRKTNTSISPAFGEKKSAELRSTNNKVGHVSLDPPKSTFPEEHISVRRGCGPLIFAHALEINQLLLAHTPPGTGVPQQFLTMNIQKFA